MQHTEDVIKKNVGLIRAQLHRFRMIDDPEAESIGYEALYKAILSFEEKKGYRFSTYASCCIYNALGSYLRTLNKKRQVTWISYNSVAYTDDNGEHEFEEFLTDNRDASHDLLQEELSEQTRRSYKLTYNELTNEKHKRIISVWKASEFLCTNKEVADQVGVSQPYVNHVINMFKNKMKKRLEDYYYG